MILARTDMKELPESCLWCDLREMVQCTVDEKIDIRSIMTTDRPDNCPLVEAINDEEMEMKQ